MTDSDFDRVRREDLLLFVNAGLTATGQGGYYHSGEKTRLSLAFLHRYICGNYRPLYSLTLASGLNHHNMAHGIFCLLASGVPEDASEKVRENELLGRLVDQLPPHRMYRLIERLAKSRVNNRRCRAVIRRFLDGRRDLAFDAVKYHRRLKIALLHSHFRAHPEVARFCFEGARGKPYTLELLETYRQAHYDSSAIYRLPFSVASGLAQKKGIARETFMERIQPMMTEREKLRHQRAGAKSYDPRKLDLVELCVYFLASRDNERENLLQAMLAKAKEQAKKICLPHGLRSQRVAAVLDRSRSSFGVREARRRPLAVTLAAHLILQESVQGYKGFWTSPTESLQYLYPLDFTNLGEPLIEALKCEPDLILVISDGRENAPRGACEAIASTVLKRFAKPPQFLHLNPVYDPDEFTPKTLGPSWPVVGIARAEDMSTAMAVARFARGQGSVDQFESFLRDRVPTLGF